MRITNRWLGLILLGVTLSSPVFIAGCAEHATVRVYDPYYGDYHVWNGGEVVYYRQWIGETHRPYREFRTLPPDEQRAYWTWRQNHPDHR
jgi:hypothetical protein